MVSTGGLWYKRKSFGKHERFYEQNVSICF